MLLVTAGKPFDGFLSSFQLVVVTAQGIGAVLSLTRAGDAFVRGQMIEHLVGRYAWIDTECLRWKFANRMFWLGACGFQFRRYSARAARGVSQ